MIKYFVNQHKNSVFNYFLTKYFACINDKKTFSESDTSFIKRKTLNDTELIKLKFTFCFMSIVIAFIVTLFLAI